MRARSPAASIVLNEFQWIHHTNAIASMISSSDGMCERGDGEASGGSARQSVRLSNERGGGRWNDVMVPGVERAFDERDSKSLGSVDMEKMEKMRKIRGAVSGPEDSKYLQGQTQGH